MAVTEAEFVAFRKSSLKCPLPRNSCAEPLIHAISFLFFRSIS
jgi:hypothetical protein